MLRRLRPGLVVTRRMARLDPVADTDELARLSFVVLHGHPPLTYALFTVAFMKQVAVPAMARTLHRRGTGDILTDTLRRNDDTLVFFGQLLDHGPASPTGRAWLARLNHIHSHFPLRDQDSLYTLATLALDPETMTAGLGRSPFTAAELEAQWRFWRSVAVGQELVDIPGTRAEMVRWSRAYVQREYAPSPEGREITDALVTAFGERVLPRRLRHLARPVVALLSPPELRRVHGLPEPSRALVLAGRVVVRAYVATLWLRPVDLGRSFVAAYGTHRYGERPPEAVGYQRRSARTPS